MALYQNLPSAVEEPFRRNFRVVFVLEVVLCGCLVPCCRLFLLSGKDKQCRVVFGVAVLHSVAVIRLVSLCKSILVVFVATVCGEEYFRVFDCLFFLAGVGCAGGRVAGECCKCRPGMDQAQSVQAHTHGSAATMF